MFSVFINVISPIFSHYSQHFTYFQASQAELSAGMGRVLRLRCLNWNFFENFWKFFKKNFKMKFVFELCSASPTLALRSGSMPWWRRFYCPVGGPASRKLCVPMPPPPLPPPGPNFFEFFYKFYKFEFRYGIPDTHTPIGLDMPSRLRRRRAATAAGPSFPPSLSADPKFLKNFQKI